jgi:hypothetical protein
MTSYTQNNIDTRLAMYTLAAGALVAGNVQAVPTKSTSSFPVSAENSSVQIFINDDAFHDFTLSSTTNLSCTFNDGFAQLTRNPSYAGGVLYHSNPEYAGMISAGSSVSGSSTFSNPPYLVTCGTNSGEFPVPTRGFVGVKFQNENGQTFYGYLDVETRAGSLISTIHGACYENYPDTPIELDACDLRHRDNPINPIAVPVGGLIPMSLAVLALGAAASRRRRRIKQ